VRVRGLSQVLGQGLGVLRMLGLVQAPKEELELGLVPAKAQGLGLVAVVHLEQGLVQALVQGQ